MSDHPKAPTVASIAEDLTLAMHVDGTFGYGYDEATNTIIIETYTDEGQVSKTYTATITIEEII
ncbi:hypothetical protein [Leucobacter aridicollis]|uniref:hypothetical protein n=1 Tax=Leucobacter aridicollis TaxID=283878 RepID=UPI0021687FCF|nr:hypothetical protein [Leucobacter aridicollis]MCS3426714.1 hypothetical protein [Leucobacter aridicollis]